MNIKELFDLSGRTVLITGGSGVLGRVMAGGLAQAGARVAVLGRREEPTQAVAATIRAAGGEALGVARSINGRREHMALEGCPLIYYFQALIPIYPLPQLL